MIVLLLVAVPMTAIAVSRWADHLAVQRAQAQRAAERLVSAVLLQQAPATGVPDPSGAVAAPPPDHRQLVGDVLIAAIATCLASSLTLLVAQTVAQRAVDRRRMRAWEAEWRATGPLWSGRR